MSKSNSLVTLAPRVVAVLAMLVQPAVAADNMGLRVGAAKIDITPAMLDKLDPMSGGAFIGVHDPIYARALLLDNGVTSAAIIATDLIEVDDTLPLRRRMQNELGIPAEHIMITASHSHSAPRLRRDNPESGAYVDAVNEKLVGALKSAKAALRPARMGVGTGTADVNVNRDLYRMQPAYNRPAGWGMGFNPAGPSDKNVWIVKFESLSGEPIALFFNYGVHSIATISTEMVSGDVAGAAERFVEQQYGNKVVALFTSGAGGDQNPKFAGVQLNGAPGPGSAPEPKDFELIRRLAWPAMEAQGYMLGSEVVRVARSIDARTLSARIAGGESEFKCPAKQEKRWEKFKDGVPVRLGVIMIDRIALTAVSGEVVTNIYTHLRKASPLNHTILMSLANGRVGYLVEDAAYDAPLFEVAGAPAARGCVEGGIVKGLVELINGNL